MRFRPSTTSFFLTYQQRGGQEQLGQSNVVDEGRGLGHQAFQTKPDAKMVFIRYSDSSALRAGHSRRLRIVFVKHL